MAKKKIETFLSLAISFPKASKKAKDKEILFHKLLSILEENKESLPVEVKSKKRARSIVLDSEDFMFTISFGKRGSTTRIRVLMNNPEKNMELANEVGNKVFNYMNAILGGGALEPSVSSHKTIAYPKKIANLATKIIGEGRLAEISEEVKQTLSAGGVYFEYKVGEREFSFATVSNERYADVLFSSITYKTKVPFDLLQTEYDELTNPMEIMKKLREMEY